MTRSLSSSGRLLVASGLLLAGLLCSSRPGMADEKVAGSKETGSKETTSKEAASKQTASVTAKAAVRAEKAATKKVPVVVSAISAEREAAALEFAQQNHPELVSLLQGLKQSAPKEYQAALADLDRTVDRLGKLKEKSSERYEHQLTEWKISSRIRLLAARLAMSEDPAVEAELRAALRERLEVRLMSQRLERDRLQKSVDKLDLTINELSSKTDAMIEKQLAELKTAIPSAKPAAKNKKRPVAAAAEDAKGAQ